MEQKCIVLTRYLYLKDEIEIACLLSFLNKSETALFWVFELYFSGFEDDLLNLLWKIYYEFYACLNPKFEKFLIEIFEEYKVGSNEKKQKLLFDVVNNFLVKPYTIDVFMLKQVTNNFEIDRSNVDLETWLENKDYEQIANFILELDLANDNEIIDVLTKCVDHFIKKNIGLKKTQILKCFKDAPYSNKRVILLSRIMHYFALLNGLKISNKKNISVEFEESSQYETIVNGEETTFRPYLILPMACKYGTNENKFLFAFKLKRDKYTENEIRDEYDYHWTYHAHKSPVWKTRMESFKGFLDHKKRRVEFPDDDLLEAFYDEYGYEPDEQKKCVQEKNIPKVSLDKTCNDFYNTYKNKMLYNVDSNYLIELDKFCL